MKKFKEICKMNQMKLKGYLAKELETYGNVKSGDGWLYRQGTFPVLLVAHMDTVHTDLPTKIKVDENKISSPNGIGGDDRCGIYMILNILPYYDCSILFCEDEEIGCIGSSKFAKTKLCESLVGKFNYIIELDRKGKNDAVFYDCDNQEFIKEIIKEDWKYDEGSYTDICELAPVLDASAVNFSCGYYNAHTKKEYVMFDEMLDSINMVKCTLNRMPEKRYEWIEQKHFGNFDEYDGYFIEYIDSNGINEVFVNAYSELEAVGQFLMEHDELRFKDICAIQEGWERYEEEYESEKYNYGHIYSSFEW